MTIAKDYEAGRAALQEKGIELLTWNLVSKQICIPADMDPKEALELVGQHHPSVTTAGWSCNDSIEAVTCGYDPMRKHVILTC